MSSILTLSATVPFSGYREYPLEGYGTNIHFFLIAALGSKLLAEITVNGSIVKQEIMLIEREGPFEISAGEIPGTAFIRLKTLDNSSIVRVLEVASRKYRLFTRNNIAAFVD